MVEEVESHPRRAFVVAPQERPPVLDSEDGQAAQVSRPLAGGQAPTHSGAIQVHQIQKRLAAGVLRCQKHVAGRHVSVPETSVVQATQQVSQRYEESLDVDLGEEL